MHLLETTLPGCFEVILDKKYDIRGNFSKIYNSKIFRESGVVANWREIFFSTSVRGSLRGMHFQVPPSDHKKLIYLVQGEIFDVALDLRKALPSYGRTYTTILNSNDPKGLVLDQGVAHGFLAISESATICYAISSCYSQSCDMGIRWDSFGVQWPFEGANLIISPRDMDFPRFANFNSPF